MEGCIDLGLRVQDSELKEEDQAQSCIQFKSALSDSQSQIPVSWKLLVINDLRAFRLKHKENLGKVVLRAAVEIRGAASGAFKSQIWQPLFSSEGEVHQGESQMQLEAGADEHSGIERAVLSVSIALI